MMHVEENPGIEQLAKAVGDLLVECRLRLAVAESCTGGWVAMALTAVPGSSGWFDRGYVTYSNASKIQMLGVRQRTLDTRGAVSEQTVVEMTQGAIAKSGVDVALAISGVAGPGGGTAEKPVGTVCFAWQRQGEEAIVARQRFDGDRQQVRRQAVAHALTQLLELVRND
jgi:nicotinamide-nucleotide amidase